jgi:hypothetical protein
MKLSNLKVSLLAVVFAFGALTAVQSCEPDQQQPCVGGKPHHKAGGAPCSDDELYSARPDCARRGPPRRVEVVEVVEVERRAPRPSCHESSRGCDEPLGAEQIIIGLQEKILAGCNQFEQERAQRRLYDYLGRGRRPEVIWAGKAIACILNEMCKPCHKPDPCPQPKTAVRAGTVKYDFKIDSCQLASVVSRFLTGIAALRTATPGKPLPVFPGTPTYVDLLGYAGLNVGFTTCGEVDICLDPCCNPCANMCCGDKKPCCGCKGKEDCGCKGALGQDCGCKGKEGCGCPKEDGKVVNEANEQAIKLLIRNLGRYADCEEVEAIFASIFDLAQPHQQRAISELYSGAHCR